MMFDDSAGKLSLEQFIASIDSFFGLWRLDSQFREQVMMYIVTKDRIRRFVDSANLDSEVEGALRAILTQLENIGPIPGATTNDDAYIAHLLTAEKLWQKIRPQPSDEKQN